MNKNNDRTNATHLLDNNSLKSIHIHCEAENKDKTDYSKHKSESLKGIPKVELHCHLDGSLSLTTIKELALRNNIAIPSDDEALLTLMRAPINCKSLGEYLTVFELPLRCLASPESFQFAVYQLLKEAAQENVIYMEIRFAPQLSATDSMSAQSIIDAAICGLNQAKNDYNIESSLILCCMRHFSSKQNMELIDIAKEYLGKGICAVDLAGGEAHYPTILYKEIFSYAKEQNIPFTIHSGECDNAINIRDAIEMGAARVGHGIAMKQSCDIRALCRNKGIGIEMCPTSNLQTKAVNSWDEYPIRTYIEEGIKVSINTDNRSVSNTNMTKELELMQNRFGINPNQLTKNAIDTSFANTVIKKQLLSRLI